jgi:hypothetical protein
LQEARPQSSGNGQMMVPQLALNLEKESTEKALKFLQSK